jgi:PAS domain S-box-containing protein
MPDQEDQKTLSTDAASDLRARVSQLEESLKLARDQRDKALEQVNFLEELINGCDDMIQIVGYDGSLKFVNQSMEKHSGFPLENVQGVDLRSLYPADEMDRINRFMDEFLSKPPGRPEIITHRVIDKSGSIHLLESSIVNRPESPINGIISVSRDITPRWRSAPLSRTLAELSSTLNVTDNLSHAVGLCIDSILAITDLDAAGCYLVDDRGDLRLESAKGLSESFLEKIDRVSKNSQIMELLKKSESLYDEAAFPKDKGDYLWDEGILSVGAITIRREEKLIGVFCAGSRTLATFPAEIKTALEVIAGQISGALARIKAQEALKLSERRLKISLQEKEALLREIHHRIKNNLSTIAGLLRLQSRRAEKEDIKELFDQSAMRVTSMGLVHEKLYLSRSLSTLNSSTYFDSLIREIKEAYGRIGSRVNVRTDLESFDLDVDIAAPLGMIVTELVSNSLKHAFPNGRPGEVVISVKRDSNGKTFLTVIDNGVGMGEKYFQSSALGVKLVEIFAKQIDAHVEVESNGGSKVTITLDKNQD